MLQDEGCRYPNGTQMKAHLPISALKGVIYETHTTIIRLTHGDRTILSNLQLSGRL